ncbi:MAG: peptidase M16 [Candidatus Aminicenantes bacterium]|nr:peptidase M16 [Candidatus Aminicenantes bacterium]
MTLRNFYLKLVALMGLWTLTLSPIFSNQTLSLSRNLPEEEFLSNGLKLIYQRDASSAITVFQILIKGGKAVEPDEKSGLAYLSTRLMLEIPDRSKIQDLMSQASHVSMNGKNDYSLIKIACLSEHLEETLKVTTQIMLKPLFSGLRIEGTKKMINYQRNTQEDDPANVAHKTYLEKLFAKQGYGGSVLGTEESLKAIKKKDIKDFYDSYFKAGNMVVAVISDLEKESLIEILDEYLAKFPSGEPAEPKPSSVIIPDERQVLIEKDTKQFFISLGFPLPKITSKNFALASIVENLLGKGVGSRLWDLRYREKLAYNVNAEATLMKEGGILEAYIETDKEKKEEALVALRKVMMSLFEKGITEEELEVTKIHAKAYFLRDNETKEIRAENLASFEALGLGHEFLHGFFLEIDAINLDEINTYIKDVLNPEKGVEIVIGPKD